MSVFGHAGRPWRPSRKRLLLVGSPLAIALALAVGAIAYWTTGGSGSAQATVGTLAAPSITNATGGAGTVALTWSSITAPGTGTVTYFVTRDGGTPAGNCPTSASPTTASSCTDTGLAAGSHSYTVTAKWRTWTATSGTTNVNLASGAATKLVFTTSPQTVVTGQLTSTITVERRDAANNPVTSGSTTVNLASTSTAGVFRDTGNTTTITSVSISSGSSNASFLYRDGNAGTPTLTASSTSLTSATQSVTVSKAATTTAVASSANPSVSGQSVTFTATVTVNSPGAGTPTGTVNFKSDGTTITGCATQTLNGSSQATCSTSFNAAGGSSHAITAVYSSDANFSASTSSTLAQSVNKADTTTTVASSANPSVTGQSITFTATVSAVAPGSGTPTGTVNFKDGGTTITGCGAKALSGGQATCSASFSASGGSHSITAVYSSDTNYNASTSSTLTQTVNKAATTTAVASSANPAVTGQSVTFTATVTATSPGSGTPTGTILFKDGSGTLGTCSAQALSSGSATCSASFNAAASPRTISAVYSGDGDYVASTSSNLSQVINKASTSTVVASSANPSVTGQSVTFTATVSATSPGSGTPTGTIQFRDGGTTLGTCGTQTMSAGSATCSASFNASAGSRTISAVYSSDANYLASTSTNLSQTVSKASTSTVVVSSANPSVTGQSVTFTATVSATSPGSGTPTGNVQFKDGSGTLASCGAVALSAGSATCSASFNASASPRTISAVYAGDNDYLTSTSSNLSQVINKASTTTAVASSANPSVTGQSVTFTATVSAVSPGSGTPTGTIQFKDGVATLGSCSAQTMSAGSATCSASFTATASPRTISAVYAGDSNFVDVNLVELDADDQSRVDLDGPRLVGQSLGDGSVGHVHGHGQRNVARVGNTERNRELQGWRQHDLGVRHTDPERQRRGDLRHEHRTTGSHTITAVYSERHELQRLDVGRTDAVRPTSSPVVGLREDVRAAGHSAAATRRSRRSTCSLTGLRQRRNDGNGGTSA